MSPRLERRWMARRGKCSERMTTSSCTQTERAGMGKSSLVSLVEQARLKLGEPHTSEQVVKVELHTNHGRRAYSVQTSNNLAVRVKMQSQSQLLEFHLRISTTLIIPRSSRLYSCEA